MVEVRVVGIDISTNEALANVGFTLNGHALYTDETGIVSFMDIAEGEHWFRITTPAGYVYAGGSAPWLPNLPLEGYFTIPVGYEGTGQPFLVELHFRPGQMPPNGEGPSPITWLLIGGSILAGLVATAVIMKYKID